MLVSVVVVNYNTFEITCNCIASIIKFTKKVPYEIIVVDNASVKDNPDIFLSRFPEVTLIKSNVNGGFAKGNNLGIKEAKGEIILLLNSDTYLTEDSISIAAMKLKEQQGIGAITVRLIYPDGKLQHTARKFRTIKSELLDLARPLLKMLPYHKRAALMLNQYFYGDFNTSCDWVSGAFMMFPAEILKSFPGNILDERFFMYGEDQLWSYQFQQLGYYNYYLSETTVVHIHGASTDADKQLRLLKVYIEREMELMQLMHSSKLYLAVFSTIFHFKEMARYYVKVIFQKLFKVSIR